MLTTDAVGGVWRYSMTLGAGLAARGIDTVLAVMGPDAAPSQQDEVAAAPGMRLIRSGLPLDWTAADAGDLARAGKALARLAASLGVDAVHLHAPALVVNAVWPCPVVAVAHSCVGTWWRAMREGAPPADFEWRIAAAAAGLRRADAVIAPTAAHAEAMRRVYGVGGIQVVHNGAEPRPRMTLARQRAVLVAGRLWDEAKGVAAIDRAAARLDAPVRAAGPLAGPNGARLALAHMAHLGVLDQPGMDAAMASATVFVSMSRYEPFGLSVLEAAQAGMRLVLADVPGFRELWDGVAIFVADEAMLPEALARALEGGPDPAPRAARYTAEATVQATLDVHERLQARVPA